MDYFTSLILFFLPAIFIFHLLHRRYRPSTGSLHLPPSPPKLPIIGHLHLVSDMPHHSFSELAKNSVQLFVSSAKLAQEILKTHDPVFSNRPQIIGAQYLSFGCTDITFSRYGPYWRQARKICVTESKTKVKLCIDSISKLPGSEVDMSEKFFVLANDVLCRVAFGKCFISDDESNRLPKVLTVTQELFAGHRVSDLRSVCDEIISEHMNRDKTVGGGNHIPAPDREDFVDVLLRVQKDGNLEVPVTDDNLKALVL
ncbi:hypothetical protein MKX01_025991, partial [Papaver californicum]